MHHFFEAITNTKGDALIGYYVKVTDGGTTVTLYADESLTPIISSSGLADAALVDSDGNAEFYVEEGTYTLNIYATDGTTLVKTIDNWAMGDVTVTAAAGYTVDSVAGLAGIASPVAGQSAVLSESGRAGPFVFDDSDLSDEVTADTAQGIYVAPDTDDTGASGAWVRSYSGPVHAKWYGLIGDWDGATGTDNYAATLAMLASVKSLATNSYNTLNPQGPKIIIDDGSYYCSATINVKQVVNIETLCGGGLIGAEATRFVFPVNTHGFIFNRHNTNGETGSVASTTGADGSQVRGLRADAVTTGATDGNSATGFYWRCRGTIEQCSAGGFARDGCAFIADEGGTYLGNCNGSVARNNNFSGNGRDGLFVYGDNTNACTFDNNDTEANGRYGSRDETTVGNLWIGGQGATNGHGDAGLFSTTSIAVRPATTDIYAVMPGQAAAASTTEPGTDSTIWTLIEASSGITPAASIPLWVSGIATCEGGCNYLQAGKHIHPSAEGRQGAFYLAAGAWLDDPAVLTTVVGPGAAAVLSTSADSFVIPKLGVSEQFVMLANEATFGDATLNSNHYYDAATDTSLWFRSNSGGFQRDGVISAARSSGLQLYGLTDLGLNIGDPFAGTVLIFSIDTNGAVIAAGKTLKVGSTTVLDSSGIVKTGVVGTGAITSSSPTAGIGYATGAGLAVTQASSRTTSVTINAVCGAITLVSAAGTATWQSFTVTNSAVAATDTIRVVQKSGTDKNMIFVTAVGAGSFEISFATTGGTTTEQPVFNYSVHKAVAA